MYLGADSTQELIKILKDNVGHTAAIHYVCQECGDDQVTDELDIDEDLISRVSNEGMAVRYECTACSRTTLWVTSNTLTGVEVY